MTEHGLRTIVFLHVVQILRWNFVDCVDDDEWIGNRHVGIGLGRKVVRGKRCRDGNVCEVYVIPFLFGSFFTVCHPYIDVHFVKCFLCDFPFFGG